MSEINNNKPINTIVFLGTPHRSDYVLDTTAMASTGKVYNVYDRGDISVQQVFGAGKNWLFSPASQTLESSINIETYKTSVIINAPFKTSPVEIKFTKDLYHSHVDLDSKNIWEQFVQPVLNKP